jgi:hypothetical protein
MQSLGFALLSYAVCARKLAHLSHEDFKVFDQSSGHPVAVMHHFGQNPWGGLDSYGCHAHGSAAGALGFAHRGNMQGGAR